MKKLSEELKKSAKLRGKFILHFTQEANPFDAYELMCEGDCVITVSSSSRKSKHPLNPKVLNDSVSSEFTDMIAELRNRVLIKEFKNFNPVLQSFKEVVFISKECNVDIKRILKIKNVFRAELIILCKMYLKKRNLSEDAKNFILNLISEIKRNRDIIDFVWGVSTVGRLGGDMIENYTLKRWHLTESLINARIMDILPGHLKGEDINLFEYVFEKVRDFVKNYGCKKIMDIKGNEFHLFVQDSGLLSCHVSYLPPQFRLNSELIFLIRKEEFKVLDDEENNEIYIALKKYMHLVGVFGVIFYYMSDDLEDTGFLDRVKVRSEILEKIRNGGRDLTQKKLRLLLFRDFYTPQLVSKSKFDLHVKKSKLGKVLILNAQGLGAKDLVDCDSLARFMARVKVSDFEDVKKIVMHMFVSRGDIITGQLREDIFEIIRLLERDGQSEFFVYRRGDSIYIYVSDCNISPKIFKRITKPLHNEYRLITIKVPKGGFKNDEDYHESMSLVCRGEEHSKNIERMRRTLENNFDFYVDLDKDYVNTVTLDDEGNVNLIDKKQFN